MASGKSTVAQWLRDAGFLVVDADRLVALLYAPGQPGAAAVRELFGPAVLTQEGAVDHPAVARQVFADPPARQRLEAAIHPLVRQHFQTLAQSATGVVVLEATLLVEAGYGPDFNLVITVEAPAAVRLARAIARGLTPEAAQARLLAQGDGAARRTGAHRVLDNAGSLEELRVKVDQLIAELRSHHEPPAADSAPGSP